MIRLEHITKTFTTKKGKVEALRDVSLEVRQGEIFGIIGYSGAGKSTLIRCVNLLEKPTSGKVIIHDQDCTSYTEKQLSAVRKKIGMIFQSFHLLKTATLYDNIAIPLRLTGYSKEEIRRRIEKYVRIVGLEDKLDAYPRQLSGGQQQRVAIARALVHEPELLLCDEATSSLDPETTDSILELLMEINRELGITILLITHEMHVIQKICDRVAVMESGQIVEQGQVVDLFTRPQHPTTKKFVRSLYRDDLQEEFLTSLRRTGDVFRLTFVGDCANEPLLAELSVQLNVRPNILAGQIVQLKNASFGILVIHLPGDQVQLNEAREFLASRGVMVERMGIA